MPSIVCLGDLWIKKISISFLQQLDLKNKNKTLVQLYRFGINGLNVALNHCIAIWPQDWSDYLAGSHRPGSASRLHLQLTAIASIPFKVAVTAARRALLFKPGVVLGLMAVSACVCCSSLLKVTPFWPSSKLEGSSQEVLTKSLFLSAKPAANEKPKKANNPNEFWAKKPMPPTE